MEILGYKYFSEEAALQDSNKLNFYYNIPTTENAETVSVVLINYGVDNENNNCWYIIYHPLCEPVLGNPTTFIITEQLDRNIQY